MKKRILTYIIVALVSAILGFLIGTNNNVFNGIGNISGTYRTNSWNGEEAVLILNKDYTCIYPTGDEGIWSVDGNIIYIEIKSSYSYADGEVHTVESLNKYKATIVDRGIMLNTCFFEKLK